jgi:hypothetical protein
MFEQERVVVRLQQRVNREQSVRVCFLSGSHGRNAGDDYSDLDVALLFTDEASRERAWQERRTFVRSVLPYLSAKSFDADHIRPYFHIALYSNGSKADYRYETVDGLLPNPWDRDIHILKDAVGWAAPFLDASAQVSRPEPSIVANDLFALDERFWVMFWDVYRLLLRGDHEKPFTIYLELLHFSLPTLLTLLPASHMAHQGLLRASYAENTRATLQHMARLLDAYIAARTAVVEQYGLAFQPDKRLETSIRQLVEKTQTALNE